MSIDLSGWTLIKQSQIESDFEGFDDEHVYVLSDGTVFYQSEYKYNYHYAYRPNVSIYSRMGKKIMLVEGMNDFAVVTETKAIKSRIVSEFKGWSGDTVFQLQNGQVWQQDKYKYKYFYAYRPEALIVKVGNRYVMTVKGKSIKVKRIK